MPTYEEVDLLDLVDEATTWQLLRAGGWFWGWAGLLGHEAERWIEISSLCGSTGESILLAAAAQIEIEALRRTIEEGLLHRYYGQAQRFFAESQGQLILGSGHRLANLVARALMLDPAYPWKYPAPRDLATRFPPSAAAPATWIPISRSADILNIATRSPHGGLVRMASALHSLRSDPAWIRLEEQRGTDFHRWRDESPYVARTVFERSGGKATITNYGAPHPADPGPMDFIESICTTSRNALDLLLPALVEIREGWQKAMSDLSSGSFEWVDGVPHLTPPGRSG